MEKKYSKIDDIVLGQAISELQSWSSEFSVKMKSEKALRIYKKSVNLGKTKWALEILEKHGNWIAHSPKSDFVMAMQMALTASKLVAFLFLFTSCTKEYSHERTCGVVFKIDMRHAYVAYPDGSISMAKKDSSYFIGKEICK